MPLTKLVNLTPHQVVLLMNNGSSIQTFPSVGYARLVEEREAGEPIHEYESGGPYPIETCYIQYAEISGLPEPREDTLYIVSALVGPIAAMMGRHDVISPDTGRAIRENGAIIGVPGFVRY